jgi:environmental stress-induced protein Ves
MTSAKILRAASRSSTRWLNGRGETSELARHPRVTPANWWWRVSVATIAEDSQFSAFPGCDRVLMPLNGDVRLVTNGTQQEVSTFGTVCFRGEDAVQAVQVTQLTTALNVIVSRAWGTADMKIRTARGSRIAPGPRQIVFVIALSSSVVTSAGALSYLDAATVETDDELVVDQGLVAEIRLTGFQ